jgi:hypothetical protein
MEVKIDYQNELILDEKKKIQWFVDEIDIQMGNEIILNRTKSGNCINSSDRNKRLGNEFLNYAMEVIDYSNPEVLDFFQDSLKDIEEKYPFIFKE